MATILTGLMPFKKKDRFSHDRILNTRWGDAAISAPMHEDWDVSAKGGPEESPDLDRDLPPTPPQSNNFTNGVFLVYDEDSELGDHAACDHERQNASISIHLPWKRRRDSFSRKQPPSTAFAVDPKFAPPKGADPTPVLATAEVTTVVYPYESRISSPVSKATPTTPVLSFRTRLADPSLADILSPVVEGFAKKGPSSRATPPIPSTQDDAGPTVWSSTDSSLRSTVARRENATIAYDPRGLGGLTMSSQATTNEQLPEFKRPSSRGIGCTAHMRASSRSRAYSIEPPSTSVEPMKRRGTSIGPVSRRAPSIEPLCRRAPSLEPVSRRAASVEPHFRCQAPSVRPSSSRTPAPLRPTIYRAASLEPHYRRAPPLEPFRRNPPSVEPTAFRNRSVDLDSADGNPPAWFTRRGYPVGPVHYTNENDHRSAIPSHGDLEPVRRRAASIEPRRRWTPSMDHSARREVSVTPILQDGSDEEERQSRNNVPSTHRATSREPRGRRGASAGPKQRVRFHSEVPRTHRHDSFSSTDGSGESDQDNHKLRDDYRRDRSIETRTIPTQLPRPHLKNSQRETLPISGQAGIGAIIMYTNANTDANNSQHKYSRTDSTTDSTQSSLAQKPTSDNPSSDNERHYAPILSSESHSYAQRDYVFGSSAREFSRRGERERIARMPQQQRGRNREKGSERMSVVNVLASHNYESGNGSASANETEEIRETFRSQNELTKNVFGERTMNSRLDSEQLQIDKVLVPNYEEIWG